MACVKVIFNSEIRRIEIQPPYSLEDLLRTIASRFGLSQEGVNHADLHLDAGKELITLKCDEDLRRSLSSGSLRVQLRIEPEARDQPRKGETGIVLIQEDERIARLEAAATAAREALEQARREKEQRLRQEAEAKKKAVMQAEREAAERLQLAAASNPVRKQIAIKVSIEGGEIRKLLFDLPFTLASLQAEIADELGLHGAPVSTKFEYMDEDKDIVTIKTDRELQLACAPGCTGHRITFSTRLGDTTVSPQTPQLCPPQPQQQLQLPPLPSRQPQPQWLPPEDERRLLSQQQEEEQAIREREESVMQSWQEEEQERRRRQEEDDARLARQLQAELDLPPPAGKIV